MVYIYDKIHGYVQYSNDELNFLDNRWVKRLKRIKQLGQLDQVFPCASHSRFEHSIGVSYLAEKYCNMLNMNSNKKVFNDKDILCIKLAGLFHDLGHGPFSHVFDNVVLKKCCNRYGFKQHEERSQLIVEKIFSETGQINDLNGYDIDNIRQMIEPDKNMIQNAEKPIFNIVNNKVCNIDVDKFDYLLRDPGHIGLDFSFDPSRIMMKSYVLGSNIIYDKSLASNIYELFYTRYKFHKEIYNHKTVKVIELMIGDALIEANNKYNFCSMLDIKNNEFLALDDSIYSNILFSSDIELMKSQKIIERIEKRDLYRNIYTKQVKNIESWNSEEYLQDKYPDRKIDDFRIVNMKLNLCNKNKNPIEKCLFRVDKYDDNSLVNGKDIELSSINNGGCEENIIMIFDTNN